MKRTLLLLLLLLGGKAFAQEPDSLTFAVLGNSISTYYDYLPPGYAVYYTAGREKDDGIQVGDQWWMQLSRLSGLSFLANASWSGSRVAADELNSNAPFLSNHRVNALGRAGAPDFIFIAGGTNDWSISRVPLGEYRTENFTDSVTFRGAYQRLLWKLTTWYPDARVVCLSILPRAESVTQKNGKGWSQADANASIKHIAEQFGQYYIDCTTIPFSSNWGLYMIPGNLHPTAAGFKLMAQHIYNRMIAQKIITRDLKRSGETDEAERLLDLSFTEEGIVNNGKFQTRIGKHGAAGTFYDAERDTYYGCSKAKASDYFYATYDADSPLAEAFNGSVTWEMLVRPDALGDQGGNIDRTCFLGSEENGGWAFYNSSLASCFAYGHKSGVKSTVKSIVGDSILIPGKFYHLVLTMDRLSHVVRYFVNGKLVCTGTRAATDMVMPVCGTPKGRKNMWICLGGDVTSGTFSGGAENSSACSFVFARIYDGALSQKAALALYNDSVKQFTEPHASHGTELLLDCAFTPSGAVNRAPSFRGRPVEMEGEVPIAYNADLNLYEAQFSRNRSQFFKYAMGDSPAIMDQLADAYSVEILCRNSSQFPTTNTRPLGFPNGYGFGLQMNSKGNIGYTTTTQGLKADGTHAKTGWSWIGAGSLTENYTHYVIVYDRRNFRSQLYVDGVLRDTRWLTFKECAVGEWTPSAWFAIGGDAHGTYDATSQTGSFPFEGDVQAVRIYGRALSGSEVESLRDISLVQEHSYSIASGGYVGVCLPYIYRVPEGCTAFIVTEIAYPVARLMPIAKAGECVPCATPVIIKGEPGSTFTLTAEDVSQADASLLTDLWPENLLTGVYPGKTLQKDEGYYLRPSGTNLYRAVGNVTLQPFSCYLISPERKTYYKMEEMDEATGIGGVKNGQWSMVNGEWSMKNGSGEMMAGKCYDLGGRQLSPHKRGPRGVVIKGGKKIATGR